MLEGLLILTMLAVLVIVVLALKLRDRNRALVLTARTLARREALAQVGAMMAGIAHELNTPMGAVCCSIDTRRRALARIREDLDALRGADPGDTPRLASLDKALGVLESTDPVLDAALDRTAGIVRHMRLVGRGEQAQVEVVDLNEVIAGSALMLRNVLKQGTELQVDAGSDVQVTGSTAALGSIVVNLLANAGQALEGRGKITVSTRRENDRVVLEVADDGPGVPSGDHDRIFELGCTSKDAEAGTGMGLFISRNVATRHGGTLTVADVPSGGAVFTLDLPAAAPAGSRD